LRSKPPGPRFGPPLLFLSKLVGAPVLFGPPGLWFPKFPGPRFGPPGLGAPGLGAKFPGPLFGPPGLGPPGRDIGLGIEPGALGRGPPVVPNGLFPGLGIAGLGAFGVEVPNGLFPGLGVCGREVSGVSVLFTEVCGFKFSAAGFDSSTFLIGASFLTLTSFAGKAAFNLFATGSSIVEEADRTNSPISCNFARTTLLS